MILSRSRDLALSTKPPTPAAASVRFRAFRGGAAASCALLAWVGIASTAPVFAQSEEPYEGPSILSRDSTTAGARGGQLLDFQFWGDITGIVDNGLTPPALNSSGQVAARGNDYGLEAGGGVSGSKSWESDQVRLDYRGDWRQYTPNNGYNGTDQFLDVQWTHQLSRHLELVMHEVGGVSNLSFGPLTYYPLANSDLLGVPLNDLFDTTAYFSQSTAELVWQETARLSFGFGGDEFLVRRESPILVNTNGYRGQGDVAYRWTMRQTISVSYAYEHFDYPRSYGYSDINQVEAGWSYGLGPRTDFAVDGGAARVDTLGLIQVALNPIIASILGENYTVTTSKREVIIPVGEARFSKRFANSALGISGGMTVMPGDGIYLTSRATSGAATYSYLGGKRLTFAVTGGYSRMTTAGEQTIAPYGGFFGGAGMTFRLYSYSHMEARYDYRQYDIVGVASKAENRVTLGLAFATGERPLAIW